MNILLINPPNDHRIYSEVPHRVGEEVASLPPLGLLYLEAALSSLGGHKVTIIDSPGDSLTYEKIEERIKEEKPDIAGISGHTHNLIDMLKVSALVKAHFPEAKVWWGGAHASAFPEASMTFKDVDGVVVGEGEKSFADVVAAHEKGEPLDKIPGILHRRDGKVVNTGPPRAIEDLDSLPHPRRDVIDYRKYYYVIGHEVTATSLVSSRGCPYRCTFCSTPGRSTFRARSAADVADEMEQCEKLGIREIYFVDDTFNVDRKRALDLCAEIVKRRIRISWNVRARINLISEELTDSLIAAGCTRIQLGVETGTDEGLKALGKGITVEEIRAVFAMLRKKKITTVAYFMIGSPHEKSPKDVMKTISFACSLDPDYCLFGVLTPYPGTALYDEGIARGILKKESWERFVTSPEEGFVPEVWTEFMTGEELYRLVDIAYKKFYFRPGQMMKKLRDVKSLPDLMRKLRAGVGIICSRG
ncbi:MAG: radical SAM protein [Candidatus Eremiobacteraeota bacterium]|nr:radical SAM protein [Candidatus Eremiobacteraeota bacterium]